MQLIIEKDYESMSERSASIIINTIKRLPGAVLCLAAGDTPRRAYQIVAETVKRNNIDVSKCRFVSLDEWVGIRPENEGSCQFFLRSTLFGPLNIHEEQIHVFDALAHDLHLECKKMDDYIRRSGGIELIVVGIGRNGHIGFNEPGVNPNLFSHVVELDNTTKTVGQKYFRESTELTAGITLGLRHLLDASQALLIANGEKKAEVIRHALEEPINSNMPASYIRQHKNSTVILDQEAAQLLQTK
jgi:glucosamine-6-phosphate isomerase